MMFDNTVYIKSNYDGWGCITLWSGRLSVEYHQTEYYDSFLESDENSDSKDESNEDSDSMDESDENSDDEEINDQE